MKKDLTEKLERFEDKMIEIGSWPLMKLFDFIIFIQDKINALCELACKI